MTLEEVFYDLDRQYGDRFHWRMLPLTNRSFVEELKREIGKDHPLAERHLWAVAKCDSDDRVLYLSENGDYYIFHLTYSEYNREGFPRYRRFSGIEEMAEAIERDIVDQEEQKT